MPGRQRFITVVCAALFAVSAAACGRTDRPRVAGDHGARLEAGEAFARRLTARGRTARPVDRTTAIALGYLERLRLGLGSPFRLIDYVLHDARLPLTVRADLAWALLGRTLEGRSYRIDAAALDRAGGGWRPTAPGIGRRHLALIEGAIVESRDPRAGELAVRLGYALAALEQSADRWAFRLAVQAAALVRDRELARLDAARLLNAADAAGTDPLRLLPRWRSERRFEVERPTLVPIPVAAEREAIDLAPRIATAVRGLDRDSPVRAAAVARRDRADAKPLLDSVAALALAVAADSPASPPQTPVVVAVDVHGDELVERADGSAERAARRRFVERATNEERFAAEYALLRGRLRRPGSVPARTALWTAVALRAYAQEPVWFPGFGGPSVRALEGRFGLAAVEFEDAMPAAWRPYFRQMLANALDDLVRVLPSVELHGLRVRFGRSARRPSSLALHDPSARRIYLPPATGAGTIAHEIAHDLDWQIALRRYRVRGDYGTDRAARARRDRLAAAVGRLASSPLQPPRPGSDEAPNHPLRPAEVFARNLDWFIAVSLAQQGRKSGYLSSVQDDVLTGYGTVRPPDVTGESGAALMEILDDVAPVYATTRKAFLDRYGPTRAATPYDLIRRVARDLETPEALPGQAAAAERFEAIEEARESALVAIDRWVCRAPGAAYDTRLESGRRRLVEHAASARARGVALDLAGQIAGHRGRRWAAHLLYGTPAPDSSLGDRATELLDGFVAQARAIRGSDIEPPPRGFALSAMPGRCAATPLVAVD